MLTSTLVAAFGGFGAVNIANAAAGPSCGLPVSGSLTPQSLPEGTSATNCHIVGRDFAANGTGVTIPPAGTGVAVDALQQDGSTIGFELEVAADGTVSYSLEGGDGGGASGAPGACDDDYWSAADRKEYDTYNWYMGDGNMPAGLTRAQSQDQYAISIDHIITQYNTCDFSGRAGWGGRAAYQGYTTYETDIDDATGHCKDRDHHSTWDAGDLPMGTVAETCSYTTPNPGVKNDLTEADVRLNRHDYDFTTTGGDPSCINHYDIQAVGTHESGHIFGLNDLGSSHANLTMYGNSYICDTRQRSLGKGDVLGLWSIYS